jgi:hypothetical protein
MAGKGGGKVGGGKGGDADLELVLEPGGKEEVATTLLLRPRGSILFLPFMSKKKIKNISSRSKTKKFRGIM